MTKVFNPLEIGLDEPETLALSVNGEDDKIDFSAYDKANKFDIKKEPTEDDELLFVDGKLAGSRGNIITITGPAKARKTVLVGGMMAAAISGNTCYKFSFTKPTVKTVYLDTEQGYGHFYKATKRTLTLAGYDDMPDHGHMVATRDMGTKDQWDYLKWLCENYSPDVVFIDGITDFLYDINDHKEVSKLQNLLLRLTKQHNALFVLVIHLTKSSGFMTGAAGTMLEKKAECVIRIQKNKKDKAMSDVDCQYSRNEDFSPFAIIFDSDTQSYVTSFESGEQGNENVSIRNPEYYSNAHHMNVLNEMFEENDMLNYGQICEFFKKRATLGQVTFGISIAKKWFQYYKTNEYVSPINNLWRRNFFDSEIDEAPF